MTKDEALKLALEALESCDEGDWSTGHVIHPSYDEDAVAKAINAIKETLAQPEQTNIERHEANVQKFLGAPQPEQEPVAWPCLIAEADFSENTVILAMQCTDYKVSSGNHWLSNTPPQRTWVELTDDEREELMDTYDVASTDYVHAIEAKLKEKNT